ncbi:hypothetical protein ACZ90_59280 [Streptomyces albus subsp. albus]|nr:hypothetical protein ACZ90_59280 [Streptomyces albus subsp. albus]
MGHPLFVRRARRVALTAAGEELLAVARRLLEQAADGLEAARRAGRGETGTLRVGFAASLALTVLPGVIRAYRERHPGVRLEIRELTTAPQLAALREGTLDAGFIRELPDDGAAELTAEVVAREPFVAVLPTGHPLAGAPRGGAPEDGAWGTGLAGAAGPVVGGARPGPGPAGPDPLPLAALAGEPFVLLPRDVGPRLHDRITGLCQEAGFTPRVVQRAVEWQTLVALVAAGLGVTIAPYAVTRIALPGVVHRPLPPGSGDTAVALCHRRADADDPLLRRFTATVRTALATEPVDRGQPGTYPMA